MNRIVFISLQGLKDCTVLTIHRKNFHSTFLCERYDQMSRSNKCLLIRQSDILMRFDCSNCRTHTKHTNNRRNNHLRMFFCRNCNQTVHPTHNRNSEIRRAYAKFFRQHLVLDCHKLWVKLTHLFLKKLNISSTRKCCHLNIPMLCNHFQSLRSNGSG